VNEQVLVLQMGILMKLDEENIDPVKSEDDELREEDF
jgi:hypothetical protein